MISISDVLGLMLRELDVFQFDIREANVGILKVKVLKQDLEKMQRVVERLPITLRVIVEELVE